MTNGTLHIGLSIAVTWLTNDAWRRPESGVEGIFSSEFYVDLAKRAEKAKLDFLFRPDTLFLAPETVAVSPGFSSLDPTVLLAAVARETEFIGLVSTASTTFNPPFVVARQLQSLNWISGGRVGWNVVTSLDGQQNFGVEAMPPAEERYARADEFVDLVRKLWQSYPNEALSIDREAGRFADVSRVRPVNHKGAHFSVAGPLNVPSAGAEIPLFQAGASPTGRDFAAGIADAVFAAAPDPEAGAELRQDLRERAVAHGRGEEAPLVLPGLSLYLADTKAEAEALFAATHARQDPARRFKAIEALIGVDLAEASPDQRVTIESLPALRADVRSRTHADLLRRYIARTAPTVRDLLERPEVIGSAHWLVVGTVDDAYREIRAWAEAGAADGFIALPGGSPRSLDLFLDELVPRLAQAGLFRREYSGATLSSHLRER
ncbi:NtaA/DmoA family FMN-dependent monooxygenase [Amorphus sp. 3PC139-8]|uniref:NtaA/DmoA family FMN-dependent monooxygenase n=1 Tax=Amorphus sp. 3PC139-8 TaxID=2735676 RepID=UPI00345C6DD5